MAVVEVGTHRIRAGYIGDVCTTLSAPSLMFTAHPEASDLSSVLQSTATSRDSTGRLIPLWTLQSLHDNVDHHLQCVRHIKNDRLKCRPEDPLMLVLPEVWHERSEILEGLTELLLEEGEEGGVVSSIYFSRPLVNSTLASGKTSAVVCDVGHSHCTVGAVLDGYLLRQSLNSIPLGGAVVTNQFRCSIEKEWRSVLEAQTHFLCGGDSSSPQGASITDCLLEDFATNVKHRYGYVHVDEEDTRTSRRKSTNQHDRTAQESSVDFRTPDGKPLHLSSIQRSGPFEVFFGQLQSDTMDCSKFNLVHFIHECKNHLDPEWQLRGVRHIISGGGASARHFTSRLLTELKKSDASYLRVEEDGLFSSPTQRDSAWVGASMAACSSSFAPMWITRKEWEEEGNSVLYRKLFL